jgi:hypothetical protein
MEFLAWWVLKSKVFAQKSAVLVKWKCCILWIDIEWGLQKLGLILESKVVQKLSLEKKVFFKKWSPKLIFLDENFFEKIRLIFDIENWLWKYNFGTFWGTGAMSIYKIQQFHLNTVDFWAKTLLFSTHQARNSMTWLTLMYINYLKKSCSINLRLRIWPNICVNTIFMLLFNIFFTTWRKSPKK